jgi:DNA-nicking Smr family endonuclease
MGGPRKKSTRQIKIIPKWEDEDRSHSHDSVKSSDNEDLKLFHQAVRFGKIDKKDLTEAKPRTPSSPAKKKDVRYDIDLHGMTVDEAQRHVVMIIENLLDKRRGQLLHIRVITGKGNNSPNKRPQLLHSIHHVVEDRFKNRLISIDASPHLLKIGDSYLKGHFDLKIR